MSTIKQRLALDKMVENGGNASKAMREAGYTKVTARNPNKLTDSIGFHELCEEKGLTDNFLVEALVEDIKEKPQNRKAELELGFKVTGKLSDRPEGSKTLILNITSESAQRFNLDGLNPTRNTERDST